MTANVLSVCGSGLPVETYDVFEVIQITRGTALESVVAADWVTVGPGKTSHVHRHNRAETVLWILDGSGYVRVGDTEQAVKPGERITIGKGVYHGVRTEDSALTFLSIQSPPILDQREGTLDLEPLGAGRDTPAS